jgi:hypothetical protein
LPVWVSPSCGQIGDDWLDWISSVYRNECLSHSHVPK